MEAKFGPRTWQHLILLGTAVLLSAATVAAQGPAQPPPQNTPTRVTLDDAIDLALKHNHSLQAARTTILQNRAQEITANLRPNPTIDWDTQFLPLFQPNEFTTDYLNNSAQFDFGLGYTLERGKKRQHRFQAAKDQTAVTTAQVSDNERTLTFNVASQFIAALLAQSNLELAETDLKSFQQSVDISEEKFKSGAMSEGDLLKIKLQMLQFQMDVSNARVARVQALATLRQLLGYESVPENYSVDGQLEYKAVTASEDDLKALALRQRPDLRAAQLGVTAAQSQLQLAKANGKHDLNTTFNYTHVGAVNSGAFFFNIQLPIFDRNQGEIARTRSIVTQMQEQQNFTSGQVLTDVKDAYEGLKSSDRIVTMYMNKYRAMAKKSRDIAEYAYHAGGLALLDFLDAERSYRAAELGYRQALASYLLGLEELREAVGSRTLP